MFSESRVVQIVKPAPGTDRDVLRRVGGYRAERSTGLALPAKSTSLARLPTPLDPKLG